MNDIIILIFLGLILGILMYSNYLIVKQNKFHKQINKELFNIPKDYKYKRRNKNEKKKGNIK